MELLVNACPQDAAWEGDGARRRYWPITAPLRLWHLCSLDAPTVAVVWALGFAWAAQVHVPFWPLLLLALVAWVVYVGDRLLDARAGMRTPPRHLMRDRHRYHWRHRRILLPLAVAATTVATWIVFTMLPARAIKPDTVAAAAALAYFSTVHFRLRLPPALARVLDRISSRECLIGGLFTTACLLPAWSCVLPVWSQQGPTAAPALSRAPLLLLSAFLAILAWLNCRAISIWESEANTADPSRVSHLSNRIGFAGLLLAGTVVAVQPRSAVLLAAGAASALLLGLLDRLRHRAAALTLRAAADLVLVLPFLVIGFMNGKP